MDSFSTAPALTIYRESNRRAPSRGELVSGDVRKETVEKSKNTSKRTGLRHEKKREKKERRKASVPVLSQGVAITTTETAYLLCPIKRVPLFRCNQPRLRQWQSRTRTPPKETRGKKQKKAGSTLEYQECVYREKTQVDRQMNNWRRKKKRSKAARASRLL